MRPAPTAVVVGLALALLGSPAPAADSATIAAAEKFLGDSDPAERIKGLVMLDEVGRSAAAEKVAVKALRDPDWGVQIRACRTLAKVGAKSAVEPLADLAVEGEIQWVRDAAVEGLRGIDAGEGCDAVLGLAARQARDEVLRARGLDSAGHLAAARHADRLAGYARSKETVVAAASVRAVGRLGGDTAARKQVLDVLDGALARRADKKYFLAYAAAIEGLGRIDAPEARERLVSELMQQSGEDFYVDERVARGLAAQDAAKVADAVRAGFAAAKKPDELRRLARLAGRLRLSGVRAEVEALVPHKEERVRSEAAKALGAIGDRLSATALLPLLDDKGNFARVEGITALARVLPPEEFRALGDRIRKDPVAEMRVQFVVEIQDAGRPEGIDALRPLLADPDWRVSTAAACTVGTLGVGDDLPLLVPLAADRNWKIRAAAFEGMGRLRAAKAIPLLAEGLADKDPVVRGVCHANLQILSGEKLGPDPAAWRTYWELKGSSLNLVKKSRRQKAPEGPAKKVDAHDYVKQHEYAIEVLQKARILVVLGAWDKVQIVLGHLKIPHQAMRAQQLKDSGLNPNQILLVNCEGNMDKDTQDRVRWFVNVGGSLMTTDWALTKTVEPCFPGYVRQFSGSSTGNDVVVVEDASPGHPLTQGIFENVPALQWWLEIQAFPITVSWPERCEVLVDSAVMRQRYGSSPMAVTFRWGLGRVQHSLSHFFLQEEGMQQASEPRARMVFAADHLGLSLEQIRQIAKEGGFEGQLNEETMKKIAPDYSMFRLIVNVVREKSDWVENL